MFSSSREEQNWKCRRSASVVDTSEVDRCRSSVLQTFFDQTFCDGESRDPQQPQHVVALVSSLMACVRCRACTIRVSAMRLDCHTRSC